jgi:hypothetical protein
MQCTMSLLVVINSKDECVNKEDTMNKKEVHDFHLIMDQKMKKRLGGLKFFRDCQGLSRVIVNILQLLSPVVKREHRWGEQRMSRYKNVCTDPDEIRENVHVYLPGNLYRELKLMHQDLNFYSIAQMVREFLEWFLEFVDGHLHKNDNRGSTNVEQCEGDALVELKAIFSQWKKEEADDRLTLCEYMRQLFRIIRHLPEKNRYVNIYNKDFSPFWILRM